MSDEKIIVLVSDKDDGKHGEISVVDDPQQAERLVETLLEAGFQQERIRVFTGRSSEFEVSQRPVVALAADGGGQATGRPGPTFDRGDAGGEEETRRSPVEEAPAGEPEAEQPAVEQTVAAAAPQDLAQAQPAPHQGEEGETPEPAEAAPAKFSSLFRSA